MSGADARLELAPDPSFVTDLAGTIVALNGAAQAFGPSVTAESAILAVFVRADHHQLLEALRTLELEKADHFDLQVELAGRAEPAVAWVRAVRTHWGASPEPAVHWTVRELDALDASRRELAQTAALKDAYLLALAHDLRGPVSSLRAMTELLRHHAADPERVVRLSEGLGQSAREIDLIIRDLLDAKRLEHGGVKVRRQLTSLRELVHRSVETSGAQGVAEVDVPDRVVCVDPAVCTRILMNLLANARHHGPPGGSIWVRASADDHEVTITVDDAGPGIRDEARDAVFDLFHQLDGGSGIGVGLYLVRRFAVLHGGTATIRDAPGGGASVEVRLAT